MRLGLMLGRSLAVVVLVLVVLAVQIEADPSRLPLVYAMAALGPVSGWRCAQGRPYVYDPRHEQPDARLLADPPEQRVAEVARGVEVEKVEADLHGGATVLWTRVPSAAGSERRVYVLSPGRSREVTLGSALDRVICHSQLGGWEIIGEHGLG